MSVVIVTQEQIAATLRHFHAAAELESECVVLFLGRRVGDQIIVAEAWRPEQTAGEGFFEIPSVSMETLFARLRAGRLMIAAQIHTHPHEAFHSIADDRWAVVRHEGALSLVLPWFARQTNLETFLRDVVTFRLSALDEWEEVRPGDLPQHFQIRHE